MRKLILIIAFLCSLLVVTGGREVRASVNNTTPSSLTIGHELSTEWQCERIYNSDLGMPRLVDAPAATCAAPSTVRAVTVHPSLVPMLLHAVVAAKPHELKQISTSDFIIRYAATRAVDYYIYCLRRLII